MVHAHDKEHKLQSKWCRQIRVKAAKSNLLFVVEHNINARQLTVHSQRPILYIFSNQRQKALEKLKEQETHFHTTYHLVEAIIRPQKEKGEYGVAIQWYGFEENNDQRWDLFQRIRDD